tara:strand:+ start:332 stop:1318 length:987 start_codon:yes stop_codon:yes gene_type:complete
MEVGDIHVGKQLSCVYTPQGLNPTTAVNPFGFGEKAVCGTGHFNGGVLVGSGKYFAVPHPTASLMVTRPALDENPGATAPAIVHIRGALPIPPTPTDVIVGDEALGPVGVKMFCSTLNIVTASLAVEIAPLKKKTIALEKATGAKVDTGTQVETGAQAQAGAEARASAKAIMGPTAFSGTVTAPAFVGTINPQAWKGFDIKHPNKDNYRLRHICLEGPEAGVYFRGKLDGTNIIKLPEYWKGLIDYDTITVNLTPYGRKDDLFVKDIDEDRIIVSGNRLTNVKCFYDVHASRIDGEPLIVEYEGSTPADYPGSADQYSISGFDYGRNQ